MGRDRVSCHPPIGDKWRGWRKKQILGSLVLVLGSGEVNAGRRGTFLAPAKPSAMVWKGSPEALSFALTHCLKMEGSTGKRAIPQDRTGEREMRPPIQKLSLYKAGSCLDLVPSSFIKGREGTSAVTWPGLDKDLPLLM